MSASHSDPTWQSHSPKRGRARLSRTLRRIGVVATLTMLLGLLVYLMFPPFFAPRTKLILLGASPSKHFDVSPIPYIEEDLRSLGSISHLRGEDLSEMLGSPRAASRIAQQSAVGSLRACDTLIVYVAAHGIADADGAYLLCEDFELRKPRSGRLGIAQLLEIVRTSQAGTKLIVFNAGTIQFDPRLGVQTNSFPQRVAEAVAATGDPTLWVLCSNSTMQRSHRIDAARRTVFGALVSAGLEGAADLDRSGTIMMDELFHFASSNLGKWVDSGAHWDDQQSPKLIWGGGTAAKPDPPLVRLAQEQRDRTWTTEMVFAKGRPDQSAEKTQSENESPQVTNVSLRLQTQSTETQSIEQRLVDAWRQADQLEDLTESSPHRLHELRHRLLVLEQRVRFGSREQCSTASADLTKLLESHLPKGRSTDTNTAAEKDIADQFSIELAATLDEMDRKAFDALFKKRWSVDLARRPELRFIHTMSTQKELEWDLIRVAAASSLASDSVASLDLEIPGWLRQNVECGDRLRLFAKQLILRPIGKNWQRRARKLMVEALQHYDDAKQDFLRVKEARSIRDRSLQRLPAFLAVHCRAPACSEESRVEILNLIHQTRQLCACLDPDHREMDELELARKSTSAQLDRVDSVFGNGLASQILHGPPTRTNFYQARRLLSTDLLDSDLRAELSRWIDSTEREWIGTFELVCEETGETPSRSNDEERQRFLARSVQLEKEYASLIQLRSEPGASSPLEASIARVDTQSFGQALEHLYVDLARRIASYDHSREAVEEKAFALRFLDPRDAWRFENVSVNELSLTTREASHKRWQRDRQWQAAVLRSEKAEGSPAGLSIPHFTSASSIDLQYAGSKRTPITLRNETASPIRVRLALDFDNRAVSVGLRETSAAAQSNEWGWDDGRTAYGSRRSSMLTIPGNGSIDLELEVRRVKNACSVTEVVCDLIAEPQGSIANRTLPVVLSRRTIEVRLPLAEVLVRQGSQRYESRYDGLTLLPFPNRTEAFHFGLAGQRQGTGPLELNLYQQDPAASELFDSESFADGLGPRIAEFVISGKDGTTSESNAAKEAPAETPKADPAAAETPEAPSIDLSMGVIAEIRDPQTGRATYRPIQFAVQRPRRYISMEVRYDASRHQIQIDAKASNPDFLPNGVPVRIHCEVPGENGKLSGKLSGFVSRAHPSDRMFIDAESLAESQPRVIVQVDDYPRAFVYDVPCDGPSVLCGEQTDLVEISMSPSEDRTIVPPSQSIPVTVSVNTPPGSFSDLSDVIEVGYDLDGDGQPDPETVFRRFSDRQVRVGFLGAKPNGEVKLRSNVADHTYDLPSTRLENLAIQVAGRVKVANSQRVARPIEFFVDTAPPLVGPVRLKQTSSFTKPGAECEVLVYADDASAGILHLEAAFDVDGSGEFPEKEKLFAGAAVGNGQWLIKVKTLPDVGKQRLLIRGTDRVGNVSAPIPHDLEVRLPATADEVTLDADLLSLEGTIRYRGQKLADVEVTLTAAAKDEKEPAEKPISVRSNDQGLYEFPNLKPGPYKIRARAVIRNRVHLTDKQETLQSGPDGKHKLDLVLP